MFRLGMRLAVKGGREAIVRLFITALAVMIGTTLLFSVLAMFQGYQAAQAKPCFMVSDPDCTPGLLTETPSDSESVLGLYRKDVYKGKTITRLDVAKLSDYSLAIPGVSRMPKAGEYYVSPAMAVLLEQAPADELGDRYPGEQVGTIGEAGLHSPDELVIISGREAADISHLPEAVHVKSIGAEAGDSNTTFLQFVAALGAAALLFPMLVLVGSATRLGAARREERYAAFRLVGATPRQVNIIASADAVLGSALGVIAGIGLFFALQPFLADFALTDSRFFASDVRPAVWEFLLITVGVPVSAVIAAFLSLRRIKISPLGVSRKTTPPTPRAIGLLPLALGVILFTGAVLVASSEDPPFLAVPGLILIMVGLVTGGPWLTMQTVRIIAKLARGASALLAVRRLTDNPKAAFRAVSGLVLVVFTASVVAFMAPVALTQNLSTGDGTLNNVLTVEFFPSIDDRGSVVPGLKPAEGKQLIQQLQSISDVEVFPIYTAGSSNSPTQTEPAPQGAGSDVGPPPAFIDCSSLERLSTLGTCPAGAQAVSIGFDVFEDIILQHEVGSLVTEESQSQSINANTMPLRGLLVQTDDATALEKARTLLSQKVVTPADGSLLTFGETREAALATEAKLQAIISAAVVITLVTAGSSIAVAVAGGMIERRRPFALLRLSGAPLGTLYKVVLWEAVIPLISATLAAAAIGFGAAALVIVKLVPDSANAHIEMPDLPYILALVAGPVIALLVVSATLPLVGRLTKPDNIRFE